MGYLRWAREHKESGKTLTLPWRREEGETDQWNRQGWLEALGVQLRRDILSVYPDVCTVLPSCVCVSNAWLPVCRAGEGRSIWVNSGLKIYKMGETAEQRGGESGFFWAESCWSDGWQDLGKRGKRWSRKEVMQSKGLRWKGALKLMKSLWRQRTGSSEESWKAGRERQGSVIRECLH